MTTKNIKKKIVILIALLCTISISVFCISRYGWKLFGFRYCSDPSIIYVDSITIDSNDNFVNLTGNTSASAPAFIGFAYKSEVNILYVGMKYNFLLGFFNRNGGFDIRIPVDTKTFDKIILIGNQSEKIVWEKGSPQ